jgi:gamma-glutamylcyclotransferase (GGCT)/AIG2-like uncharacterized protein YtfP
MEIFVYGTLKSGYGNNRLLSGAKFLREAVTDAQYVMYSSGFPYLIPEDQNWNEEEAPNAASVKGEVWEIDPAIHLAKLDRLESEGSFYDRVTATVNNGEIIQLYQGNRNASGRIRSHFSLATPTRSEGGTFLEWS